LLITQDLSFAEQIAQRWLLLSEGQLVAECTPDRVMGNQAAMQRALWSPRTVSSFTA
jgi:ABC-type branched-subunit amino acid transport system ATPase component